MLKPEKSNRNDWLKIPYSEAWKQYVHEESMSHTKNTLFLSAHVAMLAILTGIAGVLIKSNSFNVKPDSINYEIAVLAILAILISLLGRKINKYWKDVNQAHRSVAVARWMTIRAIEVENNLEDTGAASIEHEWRKHLKTSKDIYYLFQIWINLKIIT